MNAYIMVRRLRGPAFLLLVGVLALLNQLDVISWGHSWPLFMILGGVLLLAERAALAATGGYPQPPYPGQPNPGPNPGTSIAVTPQSPIVQSSASAQGFAQDSGKDPEGGQS